MMISKNIDRLLDCTRTCRCLWTLPPCDGLPVLRFAALSVLLRINIAKKAKTFLIAKTEAGIRASINIVASSL